MDHETAVSVAQQSIRSTRTRKKRMYLWIYAISLSVVLVGLLPFVHGPIGLLLLLLCVFWLITGYLLLKCRDEQPIELWDRFGHASDEEYEAPQLSEKERKLQEELRRESRKLSFCYRSSLIVFLLTVVGIFGGLALGVISNESGMLAISAVSIVTGIFLLGSLQMNGDNAAREAESRIEKIGTEGIGAVVDFLQSSDDRLHDAAIGALTKVLRSVRASDGPYVSLPHRRYLYAMLVPWKAKAQPSLALAVLHMAEQFADPLAQPYLRELLAMENPNTEQQRELVSGAYRALQAIGQADAELGKRGTLVSPASAPEVGADSLLRPGAAVENAPERLLRLPSSDAEL